MKTMHRRPPPVARAVMAVVVATAAAAVAGLIIGWGATGASAGTTYQVRMAALASGSGATARWNPCQKDIAWRTNLSGLPAGQQGAMLKQLKTGFSRLAAADGMTYRYAGTTPFVPRQENLVTQPADIVVAAVSPSKTDFDFTGDSLGYGGVLWATWYGDTGEGAAIVRGYVILIPSGIAKLQNGFGSGKHQGDLILHELGHATGLAHVPDRAEQMYPVLLPSAPNGYASGDLAGLAKLGRKPGCITIPARVNITDYS